VVLYDKDHGISFFKRDVRDVHPSACTSRTSPLTRIKTTCRRR
jgi:hypothetical protein